MKTNKIKLYYLTTNGCEWLEKEVEVTPHNYQAIIFYYVDENKEVAQRLVRKWRINGEVDIDMYLEVENINCDPQLYRNIINLVDSMY